MGLLDTHGQLAWNENTGQAYYRVAWPINVDPNENTFSGNITGEFSDTSYGQPIQVQGCFAPGNSSAKVVAADQQLELTIPEAANGSEAGLYAAITTGYDMPETDPLPSGREIQDNQIYYVTALQPPLNSPDKGEELTEMPEGAEIQLKVLAEGYELCRLVGYEDEEGEMGQKWKPVKDSSHIRYLGTFALISN